MRRPSPTPRFRRELVAFLLAGGLALLILLLSRRPGPTETGDGPVPEPDATPPVQEQPVEP